MSIGAESQGLIEIIGIDDQVCILCNEEGKLIGLEGNRRFGDDILAGVFYVVGEDGCGNLTSLRDAEMEKYRQLFWEPEVFSEDDVTNARLLLLLMGFEEDEYGINEAWFATNITRLPMSLAKVIWPVNTEDKIMELFFIAAEAAEAIAGEIELIALAKKRELHPVGVFEYCTIYSSWLYPLVGEWIEGMDSNDEDVRDMKKKLFTITMNK